jgi:hypothetical protein
MFPVTEVIMRARCALALWIALAPALPPSHASGQAPGPPPAPDADHPDKSLGSYSLVVTTLEPSPGDHLLNPPITLQLEAGSELAPKTSTGTKTIPAQYAIESFGNPRFDCLPAAAAGPAAQAPASPSPASSPNDACEAIDRADLAIRDPNTVAYHLVNHGAAAQLELNLQVRDLVPVSRNTLDAQWHALEVIFVPVPKTTPSQHVLSAVFVGDWNGNAVVFEPGKPLPESAKKALEDLNIHQDLGDKTLYSYKVKDPKQAK